jgi:hypothetical protein
MGRMFFQDLFFRGPIHPKNLRAEFLLLLIIGVAACALSLLNTQQTSALLDEFSVNTKEEEHDQWVAIITKWRDQPQVRAWLRVEQLKGQYSDTGTFYRKSRCNSLVQSPQCVTANSGLPDGFNAYAVVQRGTRENGLGELEFLRLEKVNRSCIYTLQFSQISPNYENYRELLGHTKIQSWYCAEALSDADVDNFIQGFDFH